jgi:hypothetical protein
MDETSRCISHAMHCCALLQESMTMRNQLLEKQLPQEAAVGDELPAPPSVALGELAGPGAAAV